MYKKTLFKNINGVLDKICFVFLPCIKTKINKEGIILLLPFFMLLFLQILHFTSLTIRYHVLISLFS